MNSEETVPAGMREFVKEHLQRLTHFATLMHPNETQGNESQVDDFVVETVHLFARESLKENGASASHSHDPLEMRVRLFGLAWDELRDTLIGVPQTAWAGRDTRGLKDLDTDLLETWRASKGKKQDGAGLEQALVARLRRVDADLRAPVVLRDVLGFSDEEVASMLSLRWGVFRHRLHRGRLELCELLKAQKGNRERAKEARSAEAPQW